MWFPLTRKGAQLCGLPTWSPRSKRSPAAACTMAEHEEYGMDDAKSFRDGFVAGWRAIMGGCCVGAAPARHCAPTDGRSEFEEGIRQAVERAARRKAERRP